MPDQKNAPRSAARRLYLYDRLTSMMCERISRVPDEHIDSKKFIEQRARSSFDIELKHEDDQFDSVQGDVDD